MKYLKMLCLFCGLITGDLLWSQTIVKDTSYTVYQTYIKLKKYYPAIQMSAPVEDSRVVEKKELVYAVICDRHLHLDVFRPAAKGTYPAVVMIHGGGWRSGNKSMEHPMAQQLALAGYVAVPVEYRLSTEASYPAAVQDIKTAIRYVKDHACELGVDTSRIAIEGESAGGQLAMLAGMSRGIEKFEGDRHGSTSTSLVHAVIDVDGISSFLMPGSLNPDRKPDSPDAYWLGGTFAEKPLIWKEASPLFYVGKDAVPTLFICSASPRFHAGRDEVVDMLQQFSIYSEVHTLPDSPHSFWLFHPWFNPTKDIMLNFLKKVF